MFKNTTYIIQTKLPIESLQTLTFHMENQYVLYSLSLRVSYIKMEQTEQPSIFLWRMFQSLTSQSIQRIK